VRTLAGPVQCKPKPHLLPETKTPLSSGWGRNATHGAPGRRWSFRPARHWVISVCLIFWCLMPSGWRFHYPTRPPGCEDVSDFHEFLEESQESERTASASMRDDIVDEGEAQLITAELDTVTRHCARLRSWLESQIIPKEGSGCRAR
jgi:hypothetical protein